LMGAKCFENRLQARVVFATKALFGLYLELAAVQRV